MARVRLNDTIYGAHVRARAKLVAVVIQLLHKHLLAGTLGCTLSGCRGRRTLITESMSASLLTQVSPIYSLVSCREFDVNLREALALRLFESRRLADNCA